MKEIPLGAQPVGNNFGGIEGGGGQNWGVGETIKGWGRGKVRGVCGTENMVVVVLCSSTEKEALTSTLPSTWHH